jgi:murein DD-endopeptidase MepM/ murein hydrolase activator NlpD
MLSAVRARGTYVSRHRAGGGSRPTPGYDGAGKRRRVAVSGEAIAAGRHRQARSDHRQLLPPVAFALPRIAGVLAIAGAVGGSLVTSGAGVAGPTVLAAVPPTGIQGSPSLEQRRVPASRSTSRTAGAETSARLKRLASLREREIAQLSQLASRRSRELGRQQWVLPMSSYRLTGRFGNRSSLWSTVHTGLDFAAPTGTPIHAVAGGEVTEAGWAGPYGYRTVVTLLDGTEIWFCHQSRIDVSVGNVLQRGERIGAVGSTGNVTGPHLHLEVRPGGRAPVDPADALAQHGATP